MDRTDYMRDYMRARYNAKKEHCRAEQNTRRLDKSTISVEDVEFYGVHLADIVKLKKLYTMIPPDMVKKALNV